MERHVCPPWIGTLLASPIRKLLQDPMEILAPHVRPGMRVMDVGPGKGFFSLPLARLVGPEGRVYCVDLQEEMLAGVERRARKAGLASRIETRLCPPGTLAIEDLAGTIDFVLAFAVVHETGNAPAFFADTSRVMKRGAKLLFAEPGGHVKPRDFEASLAAARASGLELRGTPAIRRSRTALLEKHIHENEVS